MSTAAKPPKRSNVFVGSCETAAAGWLIDFADSAYRDYHPQEGKQPETEHNYLTTEADVLSLRDQGIGAHPQCCRIGRIGYPSPFCLLLYRWGEMAEDYRAEVKQWTSDLLDSDDEVVNLAKAFTSHSWSQGLGFGGLGDMVVRRSTRAGIASLDAILDKARFRVRVEELAGKKTLDKPDAQAIKEFLEAWKRHDKDPRR